MIIKLDILSKFHDYSDEFREDRYKILFKDYESKDAIIIILGDENNEILKRIEICSM